jgi:hypothetical protein
VKLGFALGFAAGWLVLLLVEVFLDATEPQVPPIEREEPDALRVEW